MNELNVAQKEINIEVIYSTLTFYIIKDRCQMHALKVFRSPVWLLLHKSYPPHYRYIRKMRRGDRLLLTQYIYTIYTRLYTCLTCIPRFALREKVTLRLLKLLFLGSGCSRVV